MTERYVFTIKNYAILIPSYFFRYPRERCIEILERFLRRKNIDMYIGIPSYKAARIIYIKYITGHYFEEMYRVQAMIEFYPKKPEWYTPFFESRTWMYIKGKIDDKVKLKRKMVGECWYNLVVCPSVILALSKNAATYKMGFEIELIEPDEIPEGVKFNKIYRLMINYKSEYVFTPERIDCDLSRFEENLHLLTMLDKDTIISMLMSHKFRQVVLYLYRVWKVTLNCETNTPLWWWGE